MSGARTLTASYTISPNYTVTSRPATASGDDHAGDGDDRGRDRHQVV